MSTLQIQLAVVGVLILVAVLAHGIWTSRRNAPRQAQHEAAPTEPVLTDDALAADTAADPAAFVLPVPERKPSLDALIDVITPIALENVVSGDAALAALPPTRRVGSKPFAVEGLNASTQQWEMPVAGQRYSALHAGVQLANRSGALNEIEFSEYVMKTQAYADALGGTPEFPDMQDEVARARELDQFAVDHDAQLSFTLRAQEAAWSPGYILQQAGRVGFVPGAIPGRMVLPASTPGLPPVLVLSFDTHAALAEDPDQSAVREVTLNLDVAHVAREEQGFERMREVAQALSQAMDGLVTDDNGTALPMQAMDNIAQDLQALYDTLEARDLAAGSIQARRLFS
ncbi:MAG: hypothetical protein RL459_2013 [Pseudomonadota bacterium]